MIIINIDGLGYDLYTSGDMNPMALTSIYTWIYTWNGYKQVKYHTVQGQCTL